MGIRVNFSEVPDSQDFGTIALGKYPAIMHVSAYQTDEQKNYMLNGNGDKVYWTTSNGDPMWKMDMEIVEGAFKGRSILDNLNFSAGGLKRVKVIWVRGGFAEADEDVELEPEDIDGTYWWIDVDRHEVNQDRQGNVKESKYTFKAKDCKCETCRKFDGQKVNVNARIAFAGFEPMKAADVVKFKGTPAAANGAGAVAGLCAECVKGDHSHKQGRCPCPEQEHPPF